MSQQYIRVLAPPWKTLPAVGYGGVERVVVERSRALRAHGFHVELIGPGVTPELADTTVELHRLEKIDLQEAGPLSLPAKAKWLFSPAPYLYTLPYLRARRGLPSEFTINDAYRIEPWNAYLLSARFGVASTINVLHGEFLPDRIDSRLFSPALRKLTYGSLNIEYTEFLKRRGFRAFYFPNGIALPPGDLFVSEPDDYVVFVGRIDPTKSPHAAIQLARKSGMELRIIGPVRDEVYFRTMIQPGLVPPIQYLGELARPDLIEQLRHSKALVYIGTRGDPQPAVLQEAMSFGVPVLGIPPKGFSGFNDVVMHGSNGIIGKTVDDLVDQSRGLDRLDRREVRRNIEMHWTWDKVIDRHYNPIIEEVTQNL